MGVSVCEQLWANMVLLLLLLGVVGRIAMVQSQAAQGSAFSETSQSMPVYSGWTELFADAEKSAGFGGDHIEGRAGALGEVSVEVSVGPEGRSDGYGHGHSHSGGGTACIVKGSYCQCHYCKCEHGHVHCSGYGKGGGYGKKFCYGGTEGEYCHCDYCKCKHGFGQDGYGGCKGHRK